MGPVAGTIDPALAEQFARATRLFGSEHGDQGVGHDVRLRQQRHVIAWHNQRNDAEPSRELGAGPGQGAVVGA